MIRKFQKQDREALLSLLDANIPQYFHPSERVDYEKYVDEEIEDYFVVEVEGRIIGAGGINYFFEKKIARMSWDFVHPDSQSEGIGSELLQHRIEYIKNAKLIQTIEVRTSQFAYLFYKKNGFEILSMEEDYWSPGFDLVLMRMEIGISS